MFCRCTIFFYSPVSAPYFEDIGCHLICYFLLFQEKPINQINENNPHNLVSIDRIVKTHPFTVLAESSSI
mgnify:CR=1 FL=1